MAVLPASSDMLAAQNRLSLLRTTEAEWRPAGGWPEGSDIFANYLLAVHLQCALIGACGAVLAQEFPAGNEAAMPGAA